MASGIGAGLGADMLQDILRRKLEEQRIMQVAKEAEARRLQDASQFQQNIKLDERRIGNQEASTAYQHGRDAVSDQRYEEQAPLRATNLRLLTANASNAEGLPERTQAAQAAQLARDQANHTFTAGENDKNRANARTVAGMRIAGSQATAAKASDGTPAVNEVADTLSLIDQIKQDPSFSHAFGVADQYAGGLINMDPSGVNRVRALTNQLTGKLALAQAGKLKGQGQISDKERALLANAATALKFGLNEQDALAELEKIRGQFERMQPGAPAAGLSASGQKGAETPEQRLARLLGGG